MTADAAKSTQSVQQPTQQAPAPQGRSNFKYVFKVLKYFVFISATLIAVVLGTSWYYAFKKDTSDANKKGTFLNWRITQADSGMKESYKFIKKNTFDLKKYEGKMLDFVNFAQNNTNQDDKKDKSSTEHFPLHDLTPVHMPRGPILHFSLFNTTEDLQRYYKQRTFVRRYAKDEKFLKARAEKGSSISKEDLDALFKIKEERLLFDVKYDLKEEDKAGFKKNYVLIGIDEPTEQNSKSVTLETIRKSDAKDFYSKDFKNMTEIAGKTQFYAALQKFLKATQEKRLAPYKTAEALKDIKSSDYAARGSAAREANKETFELLEAIAKETYGNKDNYFYDYSIKGKSDEAEKRDMNYNIYTFLEKNGNANVRPVHTLFYSNMFLHFYYATLTAELPKRDVQKGARPQSDIDRTATAFAYLFSNVYKETTSEEHKKQNNAFLRYMSPTLYFFEDSEKAKLKTEVEKDVEVLMKEFDKNLQANTATNTAN